MFIFFVYRPYQPEIHGTHSHHRMADEYFAGHGDKR